MAAPPLDFVTPKNPIHRINPDTLARLQKAQQSPISRVFKNAAELFAKVAADLKVNINPPAAFATMPAVQRIAMGGSFEAGGGKTGFYRRLSWGRPAPTITGRANRKGSALCHPEFDRPLSVSECAAIQGFPKKWVFSGAMNDQYMQIGNAVPVHLGRAIGAAMMAHIARPITDVPRFDDMLSAAVARLRAAARNRRPAGRVSPLPQAAE